RGPAVHARAGGDDVARTRAAAGNPNRQLPRGGTGADPPRDALRRDDSVRGTATFAVLRIGTRDAVAPRAARPLRAMDGRHQARTRPRIRSSRRLALDR